jgi:hypothetical protein
MGDIIGDFGRGEATMAMLIVGCNGRYAMRECIFQAWCEVNVKGK